MTAPDDADFDRLIEALRLIGHPLRLSMLMLLARGESAVGDLVARTGQSPSLVSQQLALLRKAGLVKARREAKQVFYTLAGGRLVEVSEALAGLAWQAGPADAPASPDSARLSAAVFARVSPRV